MNKKIQTLVDQAEEYALDTYKKQLETERPDTVFFHKIRDQKFAELIIQECSSIVDNYGRWILYDKLAVKIKKDFGVNDDISS